MPSKCVTLFWYVAPCSGSFRIDCLRLTRPHGCMKRKVGRLQMPIRPGHIDTRHTKHRLHHIELEYLWSDYIDLSRAYESTLEMIRDKGFVSSRVFLTFYDE
ncbi:hypothetical protein QLX08_004641 [Tetragonisca angustula]|uniref:Uncharacterized protein n=1 Tax=Tetragonisca angustula TaxID=166442 RepID=A0AAW1A1H5_9HYME